MRLPLKAISNQWCLGPWPSVAPPLSLPPPRRTDSGGEPLCLISSSVESGAELLKVQYFKVKTLKPCCFGLTQVPVRENVWSQGGRRVCSPSHRGCVPSGQCPIRAVSHRGCVPSGLCPIRAVSHRGCVPSGQCPIRAVSHQGPIQGPHSSKDTVYEGVAFVGRGGLTEGPTSVVGIVKQHGLAYGAEPSLG